MKPWRTVGGVLVSLLVAEAAQAQSGVPPRPDAVVTPLKRQVPSAAALIGAMQRSLAAGPRLAIASSAVLASAQPPPSANDVRIEVTVTAIKPLGGSVPFHLKRTRARITLAGASQDVAGTTIAGAAVWVARATVSGGRIAVRLELFEGPTTDRPISFNRAADKPHHDFLIDTATCRVIGFAGMPACGEPIVRAGSGGGRVAEVTFHVSVAR
jgi:hypothetical protein